MFRKVVKEIDKLNKNLERTRIYEIAEILDSKSKMFFRSVLSGIGKVIGTGIGYYLITAVLIWLLQYIVRLNIPVIGKYISDIVDIVELNRR